MLSLRIVYNPAALFTGALTKNSKVRPFDDDGGPAFPAID